MPSNLRRSELGCIRTHTTQFEERTTPRILYMSGRSFEHRKAWIEARIHLVAESYAVAIHAYAVMSNHLHLVLTIDPTEVSAWRDEIVS